MFVEPLKVTQIRDKENGERKKVFLRISVFKEKSFCKNCWTKTATEMHRHSKVSRWFGGIQQTKMKKEILKLRI